MQQGVTNVLSLAPANLQRSDPHHHSGNALVVCSFALHLCEASWLPRVVQELSRATDDLLILTPHKRPQLKPEWGFDLVAERLHERVRARRYQVNV